MSGGPVSALLSRAVGDEQRRRGETYFLAGRARVVGQGPEGLEVRVLGSRSYKVVLTRQDGELLCDCDCPFFQSNVEPCKHVWAAILAGEKDGSLTARGGLTQLDPAEPAGDVDVSGDDGRMSDPFASPAAARPPDLRQRPPSWTDALDLLRAARKAARPAPAAASAAGGREILYVLDAVRSRERDRLAVRFLRRDRRRDGGWAEPKPLSVTFGEAASLPDEADRRLCALLQGGQPSWTYGDSSTYRRIEETMEVPAAAAEIFLREACATGRCLLFGGAAPGIHPLSFDAGDPWRFRIDVQEAPGADHYLVAGSLARGAETMSPADPDLLLTLGLLVAGGRIARLDHGGAFPLLGLLRRNGPLRVPRSEGVRFLTALIGMSPDLIGDLPPDLRFERVHPAPRPSVRIFRRRTWWAGDRLSAAVGFDYDGRSVAAGDGPAVVVENEARRMIVRSPEAEESALVFLRRLGFRPAGAGGPGPEAALDLAPRRLPGAVRELVRAGWKVEAEGKLYRTASAFRVEVASGIDWFELRGAASYDGVEVPLPALLAALRKGETAVLLGDGTFGILPEEWLQRYLPIAGLGEPGEDGLRFRPAQVGFLDALLAGMPEASCDEVFERARARLRSFEGVRPAEPPPGFQGTLRPYQKEGLGWFSFLREFGFGGCLADDMGLGKTVQVLALLEARRAGRRGRRKPSLVVAPRSLVFNWLREAERFTPRLRVLDNTGLVRARAASEFRPWDVVLATYGTLKRDVAVLKEADFDLVILDEAQAIKNAGTQAAKAVRLLKGDQRLVLSGTPIENHLGELWSLFEFLNPGMLGASSAFRSGILTARDPDGPARALLARALRPFILRRTKAQVARDLPEKTEQTITCFLEGTHRALYDDLREHYRSSLLSRVRRDGLAKSKIHVLEALLRLRQAACHPGLLDRKRAAEVSAKFEVLFAQLDEVLESGHKALVFSQFTSLLALVRARLDERSLRHAYLDGTMGGRRREEAVRLFQEDPGCPIFLASLKAGGFGLNLTAAEYVYLLDPWWNPAVEAQAIDRAHRIGQTRAVFAYRIVAAGTIEEKILQLQAGKRELADSILAADASLMRDLTREDLELLLS